MRYSCSSSGENGCIRQRNAASKNPAVSALQDLLFYQLTGIAFYAKNAFELDKFDNETNSKITRLLYLTNKGINFNITTMVEAINSAYHLKNRVENLYKLVCKNANKRPKRTHVSAFFKPGETLSQMVSQANVINAQKSIRASNINIFALQEIIRFSLVSTANCIERIAAEEKVSLAFYLQIYDILEYLSKEHTNINETRNYLLKSGELHTQILENLCAAYEKAYGLMERREVFVGEKKGNAILVTGEDFNFLRQLLEETKDRDINIYTYGAMNSAHSFPALNKYKNLVGIYTGKYGDLVSDIECFEGVCVLTTGNFEELTDILRGRIFATEDISMLGVTKLEKNNIQSLLNAAYDAQGFSQTVEKTKIEIGFGMKELENFTQKFYEQMKKGDIKDIVVFLITNSFSDDKEYFRKIWRMLPSTTAFLSFDNLLLANGKNKNMQTDKNFLNIGQYSNSFNLIRFLFSIAGKFRKELNDIPFYITINLSGPDTVAILLAFLSLGFKRIKINSDMPLYLTKALLKCFDEKYELEEISSPKEDAKSIMYKQK